VLQCPVAGDANGWLQESCMVDRYRPTRVVPQIRYNIRYGTVYLRALES